MKNDNEKNVNEIIDYFSSITKNISDETAMNALDLPDNFAFLDLVALADKGDVAHTSNAILLATKLGVLAGFSAANKAHCCHK